MNILSKNTRLLFLATLFCLHALAVPAMGEDNGTRRRASEHWLDKGGRPDGGGRTMIRSERRDRLKEDGDHEFRSHARDRQGNPESQDRVRAQTRSAAKSRQENAFRLDPAPGQRTDARIDRVRRAQFESREYGQIRERGHFPQARHDRRPMAVKHVIHKIPERHTVIVYGKDRYHYHLGRFYRPWSHGFILVRPPLGLIVLNIPLGSRLFISAGITYHVFGDVYYRRVPAGYQVVEPIRLPAASWPDRVVVAIDLLNVRYGPEDGEEVIAQVERYETLRVLGSAPGWLYVEVEGEDLRGWVMERHVTASAAQG